MNAWLKQMKIAFRGDTNSSDNIYKNSSDTTNSETYTGMADFRRRHAFFIKCVSLILALIFFHQQLGWSQEGRPVWAQAKPYEGAYRETLNLNGIKIPNDVAKTQEVALNGGDEVIIHVQDAHASLSAQYSIVNLLDSLVTNYDLKLVAIEGASGHIDNSILKSYPDREVRNKEVEYLMAEGYMGAGEFFSIINDNENIDLYGIENDDLYKANLESFREVAAERAERVGNINGLLEELNLLEEKISSEVLRTLNRNSILHREGRMSFTDHWNHIRALADEKRISFTPGSELSKILESIELEKSIDFARANIERRKLIDVLSSELDKDELEEIVLKSLAFKQNKIGQADFHAYLIGLAEEEGVSAEGYTNLIKFTRYVTIYESVDLFTLYREMDDFENKIREKLYRNKEEREIYNIGKMARLLKQLYSMELTNNEYLYIKEEKGKISKSDCASFVRNTCKKYNMPISGGYDLDNIFGNIDEALSFYEDAEARNSAMLNNTIERMRKDGVHVAALVTGGYHTQGLTELMKEKKLSYLVVIPKFESEKERPYIAILTNKKSAYHKLLDPAKYQISAEAFSHLLEKDPVLMKQECLRLLAQQAEKESDITKAMVRKEEWKEEFPKFYSGGKVTPEEFKNYLDSVQIVRIGRNFVAADPTGLNMALAHDGTAYDITMESEVNIKRALADVAKVAEGKPTEKAILEEFEELLYRAKNLDREKLEEVEESIYQLVKSGKYADNERRLNDKVKSLLGSKFAQVRIKRDDMVASMITKANNRIREAAVLSSPVVVEPEGVKKPVTLEDVEEESEKDRTIARIWAAALSPSQIQFAKQAGIRMKEVKRKLTVDMKIDYESTRALHINNNMEVIEMSIQLLNALHKGVTAKRGTKSAQFTEDDYAAALRFLMNHEIRHNILETDNQALEAEHIAITTRDVNEFLLSDESVQEAILWLMNNRNPNGIDAENYDEVLIRARENYRESKKHAEAIIAIKQAKTIEEIQSLLEGEYKGVAELKPLVTKAMAALDEGSKLAVLRSDYFNRHQAAMEAALRAQAHLNWYITKILIEKGTEERGALEKTNHRIVPTDEEKIRVFEIHDDLFLQETMFHINNPEATNRDIIEALRIDTTETGPKYAQELARSERITPDDLRERVEAIAAAGIDIYKGKGHSLLPLTAGLIRQKTALINTLNEEISLDPRFRGLVTDESLVPMTITMLHLGEIRLQKEKDKRVNVLLNEIKKKKELAEAKRKEAEERLAREKRISDLSEEIIQVATLVGPTADGRITLETYKDAQEAFQEIIDTDEFREIAGSEGPDAKDLIELSNRVSSEIEDGIRIAEEHEKSMLEEDAAYGEWAAQAAKEQEETERIKEDRRWAISLINEEIASPKEKYAQLVTIKGKAGSKVTTKKRFRGILAQNKDINDQYKGRLEAAKTAMEVQVEEERVDAERAQEIAALVDVARGSLKLANERLANIKSQIEKGAPEAQDIEDMRKSLSGISGVEAAINAAKEAAQKSGKSLALKKGENLDTSSFE